MGSSRPSRVGPLHDPVYRLLCQQLRQWREYAGLTQRDLGRKLKKVHTFVAKSEQGERRLDPIEFIRWCEACGVDRSEAIRQIKT